MKYINSEHESSNENGTLWLRKIFELLFEKMKR